MTLNVFMCNVVVTMGLNFTSYVQLHGCVISACIDFPLHFLWNARGDLG
jgi:hypothetical protein